MNYFHHWFKRLLTWIMAVAIVGSTMFFSMAHAATSLTSLSDILSREQVSVAADHDIRFTVATGLSDTAQTITVTFPGGFTTSTIASGDINLYYGSSSAQVNGSCASSCTNATIGASAGSAIWGAAMSSGVLTLTYPTSGGTAIVANDYARILIGTAVSGTHQITNPSGAGSTIIGVATSVGDTGQIGVYTLTSDQVGVTATVDPTLSFTISTSTIGFGHLSSAAVRYATSDSNGATTEPTAGSPVALAAATNGLTGWSMSVQDAGSGSNPGLYSSGVSTLIPAIDADNVAAGTAGYAVYAKNAGTGVTLPTGFSSGTSTTGTIARTSQVFATTAAASISTGFDLALKSSIGATTPPGNYNDTLTIICTGNF